MTGSCARIRPWPGGRPNRRRLRRPAHCYGRDDELRRLLATYEAAAAGAAKVVTVLGEAGIGKTRLLQELAASARRRGALVLFGRCLEGAWVPPYQAFVEAVTGYAAQVGAARLRADLGPAAGPLPSWSLGFASCCPMFRPPSRCSPTRSGCACWTRWHGSWPG